MEQSYAEANAKKKTTGSVIALKIILIILVILVFLASILISISTKINLLVLIGVAAIFGLIWYWPRFRVEWEYVFCDGQLDFDMIQGGERRNNILRIEIEDADAIAPIQSTKLDGYRHLEVRDYSSMNEKAVGSSKGSLKWKQTPQIFLRSNRPVMIYAYSPYKIQILPPKNLTSMK